MLREINTNILIELNITSHQYMVALLLLNGFNDHLNEYLKASNSYDTFESDLKNLSDKSFVAYDPSNVYKYNSIEILPPFMKVVGKFDDFDELYNMFPHKIIRPDGVTDYLRRDKAMCSTVYRIITKGNKDVHAHIISCLKSELKDREAKGSFGYMKRLNKWLTNKEWENYEDVVDSSLQLKTNTYGTDIE